MARQASGGWNKFLNFIGLVDDEDPRDGYGEEYDRGNYGRQSAYTPARQQRSSRATRQTPSTPQRRVTADSSRSSRYGGTSGARIGAGRTPAGYDDYQSGGRRTASRFDDSDYDYDSDVRTAPRSRFAESTPNLPERVPQQRPSRVVSRSRTVMYSLHSLEDCCEVIDQLIANNTVVLSMDDLDGRLMQRAVDTLSGAVFALHASIRKASQSGKTYLLAPNSVDVDDSY